MSNEPVLGGAHFAGTIAELPVADLIQMLLLAGKQAVITVARDGMASQVWCAAGEIVDAESGLLTGKTALYRILGFEHGSLVAALREVPRERRISGNPTRLLLEGARRKDESDALRSKLGGEQRCYRLAPGAPEPEGSSALEVALLRTLAEARTVSQVLAASDQGELETLTLLARWVEAGVLVDAEPQLAPSLAASSHSIAPRFAAAGAALAARLSQSHAARAPRASQLWLWGASATLVLVLGGYLLGARSAHTKESRVVSVVEAPAPKAVAAAEPQSYPVQLQVEPADAQIALDGEALTVGHLEVRLLRNGLVHEVRVTAPGFIPTSIRFLDAAPPPQLRLDPLPLPLPLAVPDACKPAVASGRAQTRSPGSVAKRRPLQGADRLEPVIEVIN